MELYFAIPKAITDIHWNGYVETSEALGVFCVIPEIKKRMLGRSKIIGFKEVITGEKIVNRIYYGTEYDVEHEDVDCMIKRGAQIGDIAWEIVDKCEANGLLSFEELEEYGSLTKEEVHKRLKNIRERAIKIGQLRENLVLKREEFYVNRNLDINKIYVAIPRAVTDIYYNAVAKTSEPLGTFCVKPEVKRNVFGKLVVTGFHEVITGEKIVDRESCEWAEGPTVSDKDCMVGKVVQVGDLAWDILDKSSADRILSPEELQEYMSLTPEEVHKRLKDIREKARIVGQNCCNFNEENYRYRGNMNSNEIYVAIPKGVTDIYCNSVSKTSEPLGIFIVKPKIKTNILGIKSVTGFQEVITGEEIVNSKFHSTEDDIYNEDKDCMVDGEIQVGDIVWNIVDKSTADRLLSPEELQKYMSLTPEEVHDKLKRIRLMSSIVKNNNNLVKVMRK